MTNEIDESKKGQSPRTMDRRSFMGVTLGGAAAVLAGGALAAPKSARACPGSMTGTPSSTA